MATQDQKVAFQVRQALDSYTPLRVWSARLAVNARESVVTLTGVVRTRAASQLAEKLARGVTGVKQVVNQLVVDNNVEVELARRLANDPRTQAGFPGVQVGVVFGVAYLKGLAHDKAMQDAAGEIARTTPGVEHVSNELALAA